MSRVTVDAKVKADAERLRTLIDSVPTKATPPPHTHAAADITGCPEHDHSDLQSEIDGKADASHTHTIDDISDATTTGKALVRAANAAAVIALLSGGALFTLNTVGTSEIDNDAVTYAKVQNVADARLMGRNAGSAGDMQEITLGTNLSFSGTTLNATGGGGLNDGDYGDVVVGGSGTTMDLDELGSEAELEAVLDLQDMQGAVTDGQVPDNITITEADPEVTTLTNGNFCKGTGTAVACTDSSTYLTTESDPQVGTLTNTKWCTTDGTDIDCTADAPAGTGDVTDIFNCGSGDCSSIAVTDGDLLNFSAVNASGTSEGIILPQAASVATATAEGQIAWDTGDYLAIGNGSSIERFLDDTQMFDVDNAGKCTISVTADAAASFAIAGCSYVSVTSDNATSTSRTFCIDAGVEGQKLRLFADVTTTNEVELGDGAAGACSGSTGAATFLAGVWPAATNQNNDVITLVYRTTNSGAVAAGWFEVGRAAN